MLETATIAIALLLPPLTAGSFPPETCAVLVTLGTAAAAHSLMVIGLPVAPAAMMSFMVVHVTVWLIAEQFNPCRPNRLRHETIRRATNR